MNTERAVLDAILVCVIGAAATLVLARRRTLAGWVAFGVTAVTGGLIFRAVGHVLAVGPAAHSSSFLAVPAVGFVLRLHVDGLTALFLLLAAVIALPATLYSILYMRNYPQVRVGRYYPNLLLFLAAMYGLVSTTDMMWFFFIFWQMMTLTGYALIRFESRERANIRAANRFLVMMQIACAATMIGAELLSAPAAPGAGAAAKYDFDAVSANLPLLLKAHPAGTGLAFALFLVGFGIKMGMWPFGQVWLPDAHPAAPSAVSAMLSGVMIKTGVYGLLRYFLWLAPPAARADYPLGAWGVAVTLLGTITLLTGTMQALKQEQSKRLLAFHSIGQIGYILLGAGVCMSLLPDGGPGAVSLASLGLFGALFHVVNHGLFKALLFLNAGSLLEATGTQDLNKMGGLMKYMPVTAVTALVASFSISGVPLFNGFVSKWSIYAAAVRGSGSAHYLAVCAALAILTSALTLASFIKFFGVSFLSRPSAAVMARAAEHGRLEVGWLMQLPQVGLALLCVVLGLAPALGAWLVQSALAASPQGYGLELAGAAPVRAGIATGLEPAFAGAVFAPLVLAVVLGGLLALVAFAARLGGARRRAAAPWLCGYASEAECYRYSAHHFYGEIKRWFHWLGGAPRRARIEPERGKR